MTDAAWADWVGRSETSTDVLVAAPARALAATLDRPDAEAMQLGADLPFPWVWLYFLTFTPSAGIAADGHPKRGGFLPPIELPRRMWAGSRCRFHASLRIGDDVERVSKIEKVAQKDGKAGPMVFVTVSHAIRRDGELAMEEEQDIVYLPIAERFVPPPLMPLPDCDWSERVPLDPVLLFRFSALTFNAHRIHYDRTYASKVERYPGLIVHGPLQAILLYDAACRRAPGRRPARFDFRGVRPLFDADPLTLNGRGTGETSLDLFTANGEGAVGMQASLAFQPP